MKCIDELQKIGIDNIAAKTRITQEKLQDIIDLKFDAFNITRARGFVQIIEREFHIDLSEWFEAYNNYHNANIEHNTEQSEQNIDEAVKNINIPIDGDKKDKSYIVLIVLLIVLVVAFVVFFAYNNFIVPNDSNATNQSTLTPLQEMQQQRDLAKDEAQDEVIPSDEVNQNANQSTDLVANENAKNADSTEANLSDVANDSATSTNQNIANPNVSESAIPSAILTQLDELVITPNEPLWIGIIDLKTYRKKQLSINERHIVALDGDKLIRTGHSYFSVSSGTNFAKQFIGGDNKYLLYRVDSGLSEISKAEFLELNKGQEW